MQSRLHFLMQRRSELLRATLVTSIRMQCACGVDYLIGWQVIVARRRVWAHQAMPVVRRAAVGFKFRARYPQLFDFC